MFINQKLGLWRPGAQCHAPPWKHGRINDTLDISEIRRSSPPGMVLKQPGLLNGFAGFLEPSDFSIHQLYFFFAPKQLHQLHPSILRHLGTLTGVPTQAQLAAWSGRQRSPTYSSHCWRRITHRCLHHCLEKPIKMTCLGLWKKKLSTIDGEENPAKIVDRLGPPRSSYI